MPRNNGVSWIKKSEPKFIREFKERVAYKEQSTIEAKKKKLDCDLPPEEKEEERPQVVQLRSGDLGEKEYNDLKDKEAVENSASSFGRIVFKKPQKKTVEKSSGESEQVDEACTSSSQVDEEKLPSELDSIFNLTKKEQVNDESAAAALTEEEENKKVEKKKTFLEDEEKEASISYGLQPVSKKRFVDRIAVTKATSLSASQVLAREAKAGNKRLLSFCDQEEEEDEGDN